MLFFGKLLHGLLYCLLYFVPGLVDNSELRVVLMFVYEAYKPGGARFLNQILEPLSKSKAVIAGGLVENVFAPSSQWWVILQFDQIYSDFK